MENYTGYYVGGEGGAINRSESNEFYIYMYI